MGDENIQVGDMVRNRAFPTEAPTKVIRITEVERRGFIRRTEEIATMQGMDGTWDYPVDRLRKVL